MDTKTQFSKKVLKLIKQVPKGKVATYGQIAKLAGKPHGSRGVGWLLNSCTKSHKLPWQRVLNSKGKISLPADSLNYLSQVRLLKKEGVICEFGRVDLEKYLWKKK